MTREQIIERARQWIVPPECQGQIVVVSYSDDNDGTAFGYRRIVDRSEPNAEERASYAWCDLADCGHAFECDCWEPWNFEPTRFDWHKAE